jgi:Kef-type K+ transport system membrane component KefB
VLGVGAGWAAASLSHAAHPAVYAVVLASGSAAVVVPSLEEFHVLNDRGALAVVAQVALADVASIVAVPLVLRPHRAFHALVGVVAVAACAVLLLLALRALRRTNLVLRVRRLSKRRAWALDLRLSLLVLFGLCWLATRFGASILIAGFAVGLVVAAIGGPKRFSRQVTGVAQGFFVPLYFVVLGARIDVRDLVQHAAIIELALLLIVLNLGLHIMAALITRQPIAAGLIATVQLGVPAAVATLGLQEGVLTAGDAAALMVAAIASIAICQAGVALLARDAAATVKVEPTNDQTP